MNLKQRGPRHRICARYPHAGAGDRAWCDSKAVRLSWGRRTTPRSGNRQRGRDAGAAGQGCGRSQGRTRAGRAAGDTKRPGPPARAASGRRRDEPGKRGSPNRRREIGPQGPGQRHRGRHPAAGTRRAGRFLRAATRPAKSGRPDTTASEAGGELLATYLPSRPPRPVREDGGRPGDDRSGNRPGDRKAECKRAGNGSWTDGLPPGGGTRTGCGASARQRYRTREPATRGSAATPALFRVGAHRLSEAAPKTRKRGRRVAGYRQTRPTSRCGFAAAPFSSLPLRRTRSGASSLRRETADDGAQSRRTYDARVLLVVVLAVIAPALAVGSVSYAASRFFSRYAALAVVIALLLVTPIAGVVAVRSADEHADAILPPASVLPLVILASIIASWWSAMAVGWIRARAHRHWSAHGRPALIVLGCFGLIALAGWLVTEAIAMRKVIRIRAAQHQERVHQWRDAERRLRACTIEGGRTSAERDAAKVLRQGDRRLLGVYSVYQETSSSDVPGIVASTDLGGIMSPPAFLIGRIGVGPRMWRIGVRQTPVGMSYTDPWGFARQAMGRDPDSAAACNVATQRYVARYNKVILQAGVAKEPAPEAPARSAARR